MKNVYLNKGYTLLELLIGMFLLTIALLGIIRANLYIQRLVNLNIYRNTAINIAKTEIEKLRTTDFDSIVSVCPSICNPDSTDSNCVVEYKIKNKTVKFGKSILIQTGANPDLKNIRITVCYKIFNKLKLYTINTVIRRIE